MHADKSCRSKGGLLASIWDREEQVTFPILCPSDSHPPPPMSQSLSPSPFLAVLGSSAYVCEQRLDWPVPTLASATVVLDRRNTLLSCYVVSIHSRIAVVTADIDDELHRTAVFRVLKN